MEEIYVKYIGPLQRWLMFDMLGGPRPLPMRYLVNCQKGSTALFVLSLMIYFDNWSWGAYLYLASAFTNVVCLPDVVLLVDHGTYGIIWLLKDMTVPDPAWDVYITIPSTLSSGIGLALYWAAGYIVVAHRVQVSPSLGALCVALNTLGSTLMIATDTQKYFTLKYKKGLITDGWLRWCRNTNYLGEMMIYLSFALLANHWIPYAWLAFIWSFVFMSNMINKDISLRKKDGGSVYVERSGFLVPNFAGWAANLLSPAPRD
ncbi:unnamed protein product [Aphanomyces euteiches]|nr:hypothetical protein AeRB84_016770 [Aphanomyces euteiches]